MKPTGNIVQLGVAGSIVQLGVTGNISQGGTLPWNKFWYILKSGDIWYRREMNYDGGYFVLSYSDDAGVTWETLLVLDINESSVIIDRAHVYSHRIIGTAYYVDNLLTSLGYSGVEGTDWENLYNNFDWNAYWATRTPSELIATVISSTEIDLSWTDGVDSSDGISIERSLNGVDYAEIDTVDYGDEAYSDTGLDAGTLYYYRIRSFKL